MAYDDTAAIIRVLKMATPMMAFEHTLLVLKILAVIILICGVIAIITAVMRSVAGGPRSGLLSTLGVIAIVAAVLGAFYEALNTYIGVQQTHEARFIVLLPEIIEGAYILVLGLIVWLIAAIGNRGARRT